MFSNPVVTTIIHRIVFLHPKNDNGDTPFHLAANNGHTQGNQLQGSVVWWAVALSVMKNCYPAQNNNFRLDHQAYYEKFIQAKVGDLMKFSY